MALGFFRRHTKMVMVIMALLMVSFLIGPKTFDTLFGKHAQDQTIGHMGSKDILYSQLTEAKSDLALLDRLGLVDAQGHVNAPTGKEYYFLSGNQSNRALAYTLLLQEALDNKVKASEADIDLFFSQIGRVGQAYTDMMAHLRGAGIAEKDLRATLGRWLTIQRSFVASTLDVPPSQQQLRYLSRDFFEKIRVKVLRIPAKKFLDKVDPNSIDANEINDQFHLLAKMPPDYFQDERSFGFGYQPPSRVRIQYLHIAAAPLERAIRVPEANVRDYYNANIDQFTLPTPESAPTQPSGSQPAASSAPAKMSLELARPLILHELTGQPLQDKIDALMSKASTLRDQYLHDHPGDDANVLEQISKVLMPDANAVLSLRISYSIQAETLSAAVNRLAGLANLGAIIFPWGHAGDLKISPAVQVTLSGDNITLKDALDELCRKANCPPIQWAFCDGFPTADRAVLFPAGGPGAAGFIPVSFVDSGLLDYKAVSDDPVLGHAVVNVRNNRVPLADLAFRCQELKVRQPLIQVGFVSKSELSEPQRDQIVWRLADAAIGKPLGDTPTPELKAKIEADLRLQKAFYLAADEAKMIRTPEEFDQAVKKGDMPSFETDYFARLNMSNRETGGLTTLPELKLPPSPNFAIDKYVLDELFKLSPAAQSQPASAAASQSAHDASIEIIRLPPTREVLVVHRTGYQPLTRNEYESNYRLQILQGLWMQADQSSYESWFNIQVIAQRIGFTPAEADLSKLEE